MGMDVCSIVNLEQGSDEWHEWRVSRACASETPALMGCSPWEPKTPYQLWMHKNGYAKVKENWNITRGLALEGEAREALSVKAEVEFEPACIERYIDGIHYGASLDGISPSGAVIAEIKCPGKYRDGVPENYMYQMQHQLMVSRADVCIYAVYVDGEIHTTSVHPDAKIQGEIRKAWKEFWPYQVTGEPPPLNGGDFIDLSYDEEWGRLAEDYKATYAAVKHEEQRLKEIKAALDARAGHSSAQGGGVRLSVYWQKGRVDYSAIPALADMDIEKYRQEGKFASRVTMEREEAAHGQ